MYMNEEISLANGAGGEAYRQMVQEIFIPGYGSPELNQLGDSAVLAGPGGSGELAFTTDSFVVWPLFFPGGDVGSLAVSGTVNDLAVAGAIPRYISVAMIIEAGFPTETLKRITASIAATAERAGVRVVTGDTKVVEHGRADGIYITTSGVGTFDGNWPRPPQQPCAGDALLVSGPLASHGVAVMAAREKLEFEPPLQSDARPLAGLIRSLLDSGLSVHAMRDPTRGGLGATLCEWAEDSGLNLTIKETDLPVKAEVRAACDLLGLDPLFCANEGVVALALPADQAEAAVACLRAHPDGRAARIIGQVSAGLPGQPGHVSVDTGYGTLRRVTLPEGEILPRIC